MPTSLSPRRELQEIVAALSDKDVRHVLAYARYLAARDERAVWHTFRVQGIAAAYGPAEPEYTLADANKRCGPLETGWSRITVTSAPSPA